MINVLLTILIFLTVWSSVVITCRMIRKLSIKAWLFYTFAIGATGVITHFLKVW